MAFDLREREILGMTYADTEGRYRTLIRYTPGTRVTSTNAQMHLSGSPGT
jgi:hypothetical protein